MSLTQCLTQCIGRWTALGICVAAVAGCQAGPQGEQGNIGAVGPTGATGATGELAPSISGVSPAAGFVGRTMDVVISGVGTQWDSSTTVSFGAGIAVEGVSVGSPTALVAAITISGTAAVGPCNITVTDAQGTETLTGVFHVGPPTSITTFGNLAQGSIVDVQVVNLDVANPFDNTTPDGSTFPNFNVATPAGVSVSVNSVDSFTADFLLLIDVNAAPATFSLDLQSGPPAGAITHFATAPLTVAARAATALVSGTAATGSITQAWGTALYSFTTTDPSVASFAVTGTDAATPTMAILPASGSFADLLDMNSLLLGRVYSSSTQPSPQPATFYVVVFDNSGATRYQYSLSGNETDAAYVSPPSTPDNSQSAALAFPTLPAVVQAAALASGTDSNWYSFTAAEGKAIDVQILAAPDISVSIAVYESDGVTPVGGNAQTPFEYTTAPVTTAGTYYAVVTPGSGFDVTAGTYTLLVDLQ